MQRSGSADRRRIVRYPASLPNAFLGWREESRFATVPARLVNLSLNGCLLELKDLPSVKIRQSAWVLPDKISLVEWTEGQIISIRKPLLRRCSVRILFVAPLSYEGFKILAYGPGPLDRVLPRVVPDHETDRFWR